MVGRWRSVLQRGLPLLGLVLFGFALVVLRRQLAAHHWSEITGHLRSLSPAAVTKAVLLTVAGYGVLTRYDALALQYVGKRIRPVQVVLASFIAYAMSQTLGFALFTGGAIRYRFWSSWGLSAGEIARAVGFNAITFGIGIVALVGASLVWEPAALATLIGGHPLAFRLLGGALLLLVAGYLLLSLTRLRPLRIIGLQFDIPRPALAAGQLLASCLDWGIAAGVLYVMLPAQGFGFPAFVGIFVLALVVGLASHVPGGLGVFESIMVAALAGSGNPAQILGSLVAFRAIYFLGPFLIGSLVLLGTETVRHRATLAGAARWAGRWVPGVVPYATALLTLAAGILLLLSGAIPEEPSRLQWLARLLPLSIIEASHFVASLAGMGLVILAWGLSRRLDGAWLLTLVVLLVGMAASLLKGGNYESATALFFVFLVLLPSRRRFYRRTRLLAEPLSTEWVLLVGLVLVAVVALGEFRYRRVPYSDQLWWRFALHANAPRFLRATVGATALAVGFGLLQLLRPSRRKPAFPSFEGLARVGEIVQGHGSARANLALMGDKAFLFSESGQGFIAYAVSGRSWIAMGDPVAPSSELAELAWEFRTLADRNGAWTVFYEVSPHHLPVYLDLGLTLAKLGEQARVALPGFSLEGSARSGLRRWQRLAERAGASFEVVEPAEVPGVIPELRAISDEWLEAKDAREKGFSLGRFDPAYLQHFRHALVRRNGKIVAFANIWEAPAREEASMDLMRHGRDAPEHVMDFLFINLLLWARDRGYRWFDLGMAPLSGFQRRSLAPLWHRVGGLLYQHGERFYSFKGLRRFKEKFDPVWEPVYLASPGGLALPRVLANLAKLINEGWRGVVGQ
jgi:phosphatidylglycerol lysyltransferase